MLENIFQEFKDIKFSAGLSLASVLVNTGLKQEATLMEDFAFLRQIWKDFGIYWRVKRSCLVDFEGWSCKGQQKEQERMGLLVME